MYVSYLRDAQFIQLYPSSACRATRVRQQPDARNLQLNWLWAQNRHCADTTSVRFLQIPQEGEGRQAIQYPTPSEGREEFR